MGFGALIIGDEILSGKREDRHFGQVVRTLAARGLGLAWCQYLGDDPVRLTGVLRQTLGSGDVVFSFGGIGATPDDHTRQCAAAAAGRALVRHPEAVAEILARFGDAANERRLLMAELPESARIIPNPYNRVPGFSLGDLHFFPGFPQMAWPMLEWVLNHYYGGVVRVPDVERSLIVYAPESELISLMKELLAEFPGLKVFSLPHMGEDGSRHVELGIRGRPELVAHAIGHLRRGVEALNRPWREPS